jgi:flap endonuclease-1
MGVQITELLPRTEITVESLAGKKIAVDAFNTLYQFLTTIRQRDGALLTDSKGRPTSHLAGLFNRTVKLMSMNIGLAFVFDGRAPELKKREKERRTELKRDAEVKHKLAVQAEDVEGMKKFASRTARLDKYMIEESKKLIQALGLPVIQAPSEGEAQAAFMVRNHDLYALASQDTDSLLFGAPLLVRNLSFSARKKLPGKLSYATVSPELIRLDGVFKELGIGQDQLIVLAILVGTDYNIGGVKGVGPKNALKLVKKYGDDFDSLFKGVKWHDFFDFSWRDVFDVIKNMPTTKDYSLEWGKVDVDEVKRILCDEHDFSVDRIDRGLGALIKQKEKQQQKGLGDFF